MYSREHKLYGSLDDGGLFSQFRTTLMEQLVEARGANRNHSGSVADRPERDAPRNIQNEDDVETVRQMPSRMRMDRWKRFPELLIEQRLEMFCCQWLSRILICGFNKMKQQRTLLGKLWTCCVKFLVNV
ncbi:hypothetical protein TNIN_320091 [Trichonephila inaurata madagascariensis]|uniref:Uncharacterized protein n=1 Tax=Trichonephila inaurata madagascariensis TaxID=2747483 RepID=A0A8X6I720_9ARAC|nr:hypothetical protein TNIN_320091 [Trichonephila inaurata madagascariensis]